MWRVNAIDAFSVFAGITIALGFFALIAYLVYLFVYKRIQMNHEMRLELIRQGKDIPHERDSYGSLKAGIVSAAIGAGFLIGMIFQSSSSREPIGGEIVIALVPLLIGAGLIFFHSVWGRSRRQKPHKEGYFSESVDS